MCIIIQLNDNRQEYAVLNMSSVYSTVCLLTHICSLYIWYVILYSSTVQYLMWLARSCLWLYHLVSSLPVSPMKRM